MNADAPRSWTEWILIEIRQHSEELHQLSGVDTDRSKIIQGKILPLMPSWEDCDSVGGQVSERSNVHPHQSALQGYCPPGQLFPLISFAS